jgi:hypothetical protein
MKRRMQRVLAAAVAAGVVLTGLPTGSLGLSNLVFAEDQGEETTPCTLESLGVNETNAAFFSFSDTAVETKGVTDGYSLSGTAVTISAAGTYVFSGSCSDGSIKVAKGSGDVTIVLNGLDLTALAEGTVPISLKGGSTNVTITLVDGKENRLEDAVHGDETPKSVINASKNVTINGTGTLNVFGNHKNGIKTDADLTIESGVKLNVTAVDNGISADNSITIDGGTVNVNAKGDGIVSSPDVNDDGSLSKDGNIIINGGDITIDATEDGIQADNELTINGGTFDITCNGGYTTKLTSSTSSCKGLKGASMITVNDGTFTINAADDAIHGNGYVYLLGGDFKIATGDDGAHADTSLIIGEEEGSDDALNIQVTQSYEGLEAGTVYMYSGNVSVVSSDDGVNAAGGSSNGSGGNTGDSFNPGGGFGGGPGGRPGSSNNWGNSSSSTGDYSLNIYGGNLTVNAEGDGLDSNGALTISGGNVVVFGADCKGSGSDNSALDCDGTLQITGGTVLAAGSSQMANVPSNGGQTYLLKKGTNVSSGKAINVVDSEGNAIYSVVTPKNVNHIIYSSPDITSSYSIQITDEPMKSETPETEPTTEQTEPTTEQTEPTTEQTEPTTEQTEPTTEQTEPTTEQTEPTTEQTEATKQTETSVQNPSTGAVESSAQVTVAKVSLKKAAKKTKTSVKLTWKKVSNATGYEIYRKTGKKGAYKKIKTIKKAGTVSFINKKLKTGQRYSYKVRAYRIVNGKKVYGAYSKVKTVVLK